MFRALKTSVSSTDQADTSRQSFVILANEVKTACAYYEDSQALGRGGGGELNN